MSQQVFAARVAKELKLLEESPPDGVVAWPKHDSLQELEAGNLCFKLSFTAYSSHLTKQKEIRGPADTPYKDGVFRLSIQIPDKCYCACLLRVLNFSDIPSILLV